MMSFIQELKRRNVFRVAAAYLIVSWLILQVGEVLAPALHLPNWTNSALAFFIILGFPLAMVFAWAFELTPEGLKLQRDIDRERSITQATGRRLNGWIIALLAGALALAAFDRFVLAPERNSARIEQAVQDARQIVESNAATEAGPSLAVLPFVNLSADPEQEYFSDGIAEELLNVLARYPDLRVAARTSSFRFKDSDLNIANIARELNVGYVLEGSVRKAGDRVRITAQLVEANSGFQQWSESFDRELSDVFAIQDEISAAIGEALEVSLGLDGATPRVAETDSLDAYELYLSARQLINQRGRINIERAVALLTSSIEADPNYAPARAQLGIALVMLSNGPGSYGDWPVPEAKARAMPHIERAMMLDNTLPEAHGALALAAYIASDFEGTQVHAERAVALNPSYVDAINWLGLAQVNLGLYKESTATLERSLVVDPLSVAGRANLALANSRMGKIESGISLADEIGDQSPTGRYTIRGVIAHDSQGDLVAALGWLLQLHEANPDGTNANVFLAYVFGTLDLMPEAMRLREDTLFHAYARNGNWPAAAMELEALLKENPDNPRYRVQLASALLLADFPDEARTHFEFLLAQNPGKTLRDPFWYSPYPTLHAAWLRRQDNDEAGARDLMERARQDLNAHAEAGRIISWVDRSAAMLAAMEGRDETALSHMQDAFDHGERDLGLFAEPALLRLAETPAARSLQQRMREDLARQRVNVLALLCSESADTPANRWQPLAETCEETTAR